MTFETQKEYDKNLTEYKELAKKHDEVQAQIKEFTEQAQNHLKQLAAEKDQLFIAAKACEKVITMLQPYVKTEEVPQAVSAEIPKEETENNVTNIEDKKAAKAKKA